MTFLLKFAIFFNRPSKYKQDCDLLSILCWQKSMFSPSSVSFQSLSAVYKCCVRQIKAAHTPTCPTLTAN